MKKPRIEDMTDKHEVLNPDGSFRCYGSKTFDKLTKEWEIEQAAKASTDEETLAKDGLFDPWFMSDLICIFNGEVVQSSKDHVSVSSSDFKKELLVYLNKGNEKIVYTIDDDWRSHMTKKEHLAVEGFAKTYGLRVEEWEKETNKGKTS